RSPVLAAHAGVDPPRSGARGGGHRRGDRADADAVPAADRPHEPAHRRGARGLRFHRRRLVGARPRRPRGRAEKVAARIVPHLKDGAIVLLHDAAENEDFTPASIAALPRILAAMARKDLPGVRVDAWLDAADTATSAADHHPDVVDGVRPDGGGEAAEGE